MVSTGEDSALWFTGEGNSSVASAIGAAPAWLRATTIDPEFVASDGSAIGRDPTGEAVWWSESQSVPRPLGVSVAFDQGVAPIGRDRTVVVWRGPGVPMRTHVLPISLEFEQLHWVSEDRFVASLVGDTAKQQVLALLEGAQLEPA